MIARTEIRREYHQPRHRFRRRRRRRLHLRRRRLLSFDQQASHFEAKAYVVLKMNVVSAQVVSCCIYDKSKQNSNTCIVRFHTFLTANQVDHLLLVKSSDLTTSIKQTNTKEHFYTHSLSLSFSFTCNSISFETNQVTFSEVLHRHTHTLTHPRLRQPKQAVRRLFNVRLFSSLVMCPFEIVVSHPLKCQVGCFHFLQPTVFRSQRGDNPIKATV